jgi:autotransporter-associated beta strand protein
MLLTTVAAIAGNSSVALHWQTADAGESGYTVRRATTSGGPYTTIATGITATSYQDNNLSNGITYHYVVAASSEFGSGPASNEASATPSGSALPAPWLQANVGSAAGSPTTTFNNSQFNVNGAGLQLTASNSTTDSFRFIYIPLVGDCTVTARVTALGSSNGSAKAGVMIRESLAAGARHASTLLTPSTMAFVRRANTTAASGPSVTAISQPWLRIVRSGQNFSSYYSSNGTTWLSIDQVRTVAMSTSAVYYAGLAVCSGSDTTLSNATFTNVTITGGHPTAVTATAGNASATISWSPVGGAASYRVKRSQFSGGPYTTVADGVTAATFTDGALVNGSTYHYVVSALNAALGESANSLQVAATPAPPVPPAPLNPSATANHRRVALSWESVGTATGYLVKRATSSGGPYTTVASPGGNSFTDTGLTNGTPYYYVIVAYNSGGESPASSEVSATPLLPPGSGSWTNAAGGNWDESSNWLAGTVASGVDQSAAFPQASGNVVQNLAALSLGGLSFAGGDTSLAGSALTLDRSSGTPEISVDSGSTATITLALGGGDGLAKTGGGTLVLQGTAGPGGASTVTVGNLTLRNGYSAPSFDIAGGAVLQLDHATDLNNATASFTGAGTLRKTGGGQVVWGSSTATFALAPGALIDIQGGTFVAGSFANENWANNRSDLHVAAGAVFKTVEANVRLDRITGEGTLGTGYSGAGYQNLTIGIEGGSSRFDGVISNTDQNASFVGNLVKQGAGTITLTNTSSYSGSTNIAAGTLELGDGTAGKDGRLANTSGVTNNGILAFNLHGNQSVSHAIGGSGSVRKSGPGELSFGSTHSYSGGTTVEQGVLVLSGATIGVGRIRGSATVRAGAELRVSGGDGSGLGYTGGAKIDSLHLDGGLLNSPGVCHLWQASLLLTGGELRGNNGVNDPAGPHFEWGNTPVTSFASTASSVISGRIRIRPDASPTLGFTVADGAAATDLRVDAAITQASSGAGIEKLGPGTMVLNAANQYSGPTQISAGKLLIHGAQTAATGPLTVAANATLGGNGSVGGAVTVQADGILAPGASIGTFTAAAATIAGRLAIELDGAAADRLDVTGHLDIGNATLDLTGTPAAPELVIASFASLGGTEFAAVNGLPAGYELTYDTTLKQIRLSAVEEGFAGWIDGFAVLDPDADADPDADGVDNALEYVFGTDPSQPGPDGVLPLIVSPGELTFRFERADSSESADLSLVVEAGSTLGLWPEVYTIGASSALSSPGVAIAENGAAPDTVTVTIPKGSAATKFARLKVVVTP